MLKLSNLIQKVDQFYHSALKNLELQKLGAEPQTFTMPDDEEDEEPITERKPGDKSDELYNRLQNIARAVRDENARSEALLIADMYAEAIKLGDGFNAVRKAISNFINIQLDDLDPDDDENPLNELETIFNEMHADLTARAKAAGGGVNKGDSAEGEKAVRAVKDQFNQMGLQKDLSGGGSLSDLSEIDPNAGAIFDPTGGVGKEEAEKSGRGYFVRTVKDLKDWIKSYETERQRYLEEIQTEKNPKIIAKKKELIELLDQLKVATAKTNTLNEKYQVAPDPADAAKLDEAKGYLKDLKEKKTKLKASLRNNALSLQLDQLGDIYKKVADKGPRPEEMEANPALLANPVNFQKFILYQEMQLRKVLASQDKNKGGETKWRKQLLNFLPNMSKTEIGFQSIKNILNKIQEAASKKIPIEEIWRQQAEVLEKTKGRWLSHERLPGEDKFTSGNFERAFRQLRQHLPNIKMGDKKQVIDKWREQVILHANQNERTVFGPWLDAVAAERAANKGAIKKSSAAMMALYKKLNEMVGEFTEKMTTINYRMGRLEEMYADVQSFVAHISELSKSGHVFHRVKKGAGVTDVDIKKELTQPEQHKLKELIDKVSSLAARDYPNPFGMEKERESTKPILEEVRDTLKYHLRESSSRPKHKGEEAKHETPKVKVEVTDDVTGEMTYHDMTEEEANTPIPGKEIKIIGEHMNRKQRKTALAKLRKQSFVDSSVAPEVGRLLADPSLDGIQNDQEYAHQVFQKMLAMINEKMKKISESE